MTVRNKWLCSLVVVLLAVLVMLPASAENTNVTCAAQGGNFYFDPSSGTVVDCDTSVTSVEIPAVIEGVSVSAIGENAFRDCGSLVSVTVPASVTSVGNRAFDSCDSLTGVELPGVESLGQLAFCDCTKLTSVSVGGDTVSVGAGAFRYCSSLETAAFSGTVSSLGNYAFDGCSGLTSVALRCSGLDIGKYVFNYCYALKEVIFEGSVASLGEGAFFLCSGLSEIALPEGLTSIGNEAFGGCSSLETVTLPASLVSMGNSVFGACNIRHFSVAEGSSAFAADACGVLYDLKMTRLVAYPSASGITEYTVAPGVTELRDSVFSDCEALTSVILPEGLTSIGAFAFNQCYALRSVKLPSTLRSIGEDAFASCRSLEEISLPAGLTELGAQAFVGCWRLLSVTVPGGVSGIGKSAFNGCYSLKTVILEEGVRQIGNSAFRGCTGLLRAVFPASLESIGADAFRDCAILSSVTLGDGLVSIGKNAFAFCNDLTFVFLPETLETIKSSAFFSCRALLAVNIPDSVTSIAGDSFDGSEKVVIYGSEGSYGQTYAENNGIEFSAEVLSSVSGRMLTPAAEPVHGAVILLTDEADNASVLRNATDEAGNWSFPFARIGHTYRVLYSHPEYPANGAEYVYTVGQDPVAAEPIIAVKTGFMQSGTKDIAKLTRTELNHMMKMKFPQGPMFEETPSLTQPYISGKVAAEHLDLAMERLNEARQIAGLSAVKINEQYNQYCQDASLVNALNGYISHYPPRPSGMEDALYSNGSTGAKNSNLAMHAISNAFCGPLGYSVDMYLADDDASNVAEVGHRRWALNPTMTQTGFGCVESGSYFFCAMYSKNSGALRPEYDFIAWPSSGNFPLEFSIGDLPWSVSLNPAKYNSPQQEDLTVTITEAETGEKYVLSGDKKYTEANSGEYLHVSEDIIGEGKCIVFRPEYGFLLQDLYVVEIEGLYDRWGREAKIKYYVNLTSINHAETVTESGMCNYGLEWYRDKNDLLWVNGFSELDSDLFLVAYRPDGRQLDLVSERCKKLESVNMILDCPEGTLVKLFHADEEGRPASAVWTHQF